MSSTPLITHNLIADSIDRSRKAGDDSESALLGATEMCLG